jgi:hypothetical protein
MDTIAVNRNCMYVYHMPTTFWMEYCIKNKQPFQYCQFKKEDIDDYFVEEKIRLFKGMEDENDAYKSSNCGFNSTRTNNNPLMEYVPMLETIEGTLVRVHSHFNKIFV